LFLTTRGTLMYQMKDNFENAGFTSGVIGDTILKPRRGVNVGMVQTIASWLSNPLDSDTSETANKQRERRRKMIDLLHKVEFVIGEEAHEVGGSSYYEVMSHCVNAHYRLALTATPFMRADGESNMRLQASFGSIGMEVSEELLINRGILAKPYFSFLDTPSPSTLRKGTSWPTCQSIGIVENIERNKLIVEGCLLDAKHGRTSLTLIQRKNHGGILETMFKDAGLSAKFVFGDSDQADRSSRNR
jgi:superfamily II DNA or RNA helicase